ncbi:hypothetical protein CL689_01790 [Candidatus Saccharibacteria bacterium]|nr:hypothetical protein [Candidatus Saccharibacteria bacterium]MBJ58929.1 hypothetical protein [Candidatus Saccharibacteria bacterium]MBQ68775.1 hypothetical protein [Candidatus Saccharibacteria bacterium]|tara:strand:- start:214 stop:1494 length:1281 start_codon:yes stop_codon:yes gene_type:complete
MKDLNFDALLLAAKPTSYSANNKFTDSVMRKVKQPEILSSAVRKMDVNKKETFIMKLRHLPKLAVIAIALSALVVLGSTTYAAYKLLWEQPSVTTQEPTTNQFGRTQVIASFENCANQSSATTFEIKAGSTLDPSEIGKILQARCELEALREWSGTDKPPKGPNPDMQQTEGTYTQTMRMTSPVASKVVSIDTTTLTLTGDQYNTPKDPLVLTDDTQFIVDNHESTIDQIQPGDAVLYVYDVTYDFVTKKTATGYNTSSTSAKALAVTHLVKVDLPFEYYGPGKQNQIAQREACMGNPQDSCVQTAAVDLYENYPTTQILPDDNGELPFDNREIQGIIIDHNGTTVKIQSSSGRIFTLTTPSDIVTNFNLYRSSEYNNITVQKGDLLLVRYAVDRSSTSLELSSSEIRSVYVALNMIQKGDPVQKY